MKKNNLKMVMPLALAFPALLLIGCSDTIDVSLGAPALEPPVKNATPAVMLASAVSQKVSSRTSDAVTIDAAFNIGALRSRFFTDPGGSNIFYRLGQIDERLQSLSSRSTDSQRQCLLDAVVSKEMAAALPTNETFPLSLQCVEELNEISQMAFGKTDDAFYLSEIQTMDDDALRSMAVFAKANTAGETVEFWTIFAEKEGAIPSGTDKTPLPEDQAMYLHVKASENDKTFELSVGGTSIDSGVTCGVQMRSDNEYIYATGTFQDPGFGCDNVDTQGTYCVSAADMAEVDMALCTTAGIDVFELEAIDYTTVGLAGNAVITTTTKFTGLTAFNTDAN